MAKHGGVFMTNVDGYTASNTVPSENIGGLLFDIGRRENPFSGYSVAQAKLGNRQVVEINSLEDAVQLGIEENGLLGGVAYYHIEKFFALAGSGQRLFIMFADCTSNFNAIEDMQTAAKGLCFHIGLWTEQELFTKVNDEYRLNSWVASVETVCEKLGGRIKKQGENYVNYDGNAQVVVVINANPGYITDGQSAIKEIDLTKLPNAISSCPYVAISLGQESSDDVHTMQLHNHNQCPVGNIGMALGVLAVAPVQHSIGYVANYNLFAACQSAELGFGNLATTGEGAQIAWAANASFTHIDTLTYTKRNTQIIQKGYIMLTNYDGYENGIYFSGDTTLSDGDFRTIARCRTMAKARRLVRMALLPYVNAPVQVNASTGLLSASQITTFKNLITSALDTGMVNPGSSVSQISGRTVTIDSNQNILKNDELIIDFGIVPVGTTTIINVTEHFATSTSA